ncbi:subtilisin-like protein [Coniochaeta ligniaria NRRL 30616]|uniref:Subtilisin-like protein n=1 Tax=Coniochaeta ligniaria NRRL 30616 TaxID=1408157 RepID=A0A1J7JXW8_9PEZI|nr:subtilisin-like protein [Coniochaeta ligniaria NRRL 30616]
MHNMLNLRVVSLVLWVLSSCLVRCSASPTRAARAAAGLSVDSATSTNQAQGPALTGLQCGNIVFESQAVSCCSAADGHVGACLQGSQCDPFFDLSGTPGIPLDGSTEYACTDPPGVMCGCGSADGQFPYQFCRSTSDWQCCGERTTLSSFWCRTDQTCGSSACNSPAIIQSFGATSYKGCYGDLGNSRTLRNTTTVGSDMSVETCTDFCYSGGWQYAGVENGNECYCGDVVFDNGQFPDSDCTANCAGADNEICGGNSRMNLYQNSDWVNPTVANMIQALQDWQAALDVVQGAISAFYQASEQVNQASLEAQSQSTPSRHRRADTGLDIPLRLLASAVNTGSDFHDQTIRVRNAAQAAANTGVATQDIVAQIESLDSSVTSALRGLQIASNAAIGDLLASARVAIRVIGAPEIALTGGAAVVSALAVYAGIHNLLSFFGLFGGSAGGGDVPTTPADVPPAQGSARDLIVLFSTETTEPQFYNTLAELELGGAVIRESWVDQKVKVFGLFGSLFDSQVTQLDASPLTTTICNDAIGTIWDSANDDGGYVTFYDGSGDDSDTQARSVVKHSAANSTMDRRGLRLAERDEAAVFQIGNFRKPSGAVIAGEPWPHLRWMSSLWAKIGLVGNFLDADFYFWKSDSPNQNVVVYIMDTGALVTHQDFVMGNNMNEGYNLDRFAFNSENNGLNTLDHGKHGTAMASLIGGYVSGVAKGVQLIPLQVASENDDNNASQLDVTVHTFKVVGAFLKLLQLQNGKGKPAAVLNLSISFIRAALSTGLITATDNDPFHHFLPLVTEANVAVNIAAGNDPSRDLDTYTPNVLGGEGTPYVIVGSTDASGKRSSFSTYLDPDQKGYVSIYNIGEDTLCASNFTNNAFGAITGTSPATALISGLTAVMLANGDATVQNFKQQLQEFGRTRKGTDWAAEFGRVIPRAATSWEIPCDLPTSTAPLFRGYKVLNEPSALTLSINYVPQAQAAAMPDFGLTSSTCTKTPKRFRSQPQHHQHHQQQHQQHQQQQKYSRFLPLTDMVAVARDESRRSAAELEKCMVTVLVLVGLGTRL